MPISGYYGGHGEKVAADMKKRYGKRWKSVFYATDAKRKKRKSKRSQHKAALEAMRRGR